MRIWILSDLHRDVGVPWSPPAIPDADVAVIAGDVGEGIEGSLAWMAQAIRPHMRVVFVAGNRESESQSPSPTFPATSIASKSGGSGST